MSTLYYVPVNIAPVIFMVVAGFILAFILSFAVGANDVANFFGTVVGTKTLTIKWAFVIAAIFEISGAILLGLKVTETVRKGIIDPNDIIKAYRNTTNCLRPLYLPYNTSLIENYHGQIGCPELISMESSIGALVGSSSWLMVANIFKMPVSSTHSIVGSTAGTGLVAIGYKSIGWKTLGFIVTSWFISPLLSGFISVTIYSILWYFFLRKTLSFEKFKKFTPIIYFLTIFISIFAIVYKGSSLLYFDKIPAYGVFILSFGLGIIIAILDYFIFGIFIEKKVKREFPLYYTSSDKQYVNSINTLNEKNKPVTKNEIQKSNTIEEIINKIKDCIDPRTEKLFYIPQIMIACFGAFVHGGNDISNSVSPLMNIWVVFKNQTISKSVKPPVWILFYGSAGIVFGLIILGRRVISTIGTDLTKLAPSSSFAIELGSALTVLIATILKMPVSTTHCQIGSVVCVGMFQNGIKSVNLKLIRNIIFSWLITLPFSAIVAAIVFTINREIVSLWISKY